MNSVHGCICTAARCLPGGRGLGCNAHMSVQSSLLHHQCWPCRRVCCRIRYEMSTFDEIVQLIAAWLWVGTRKRG